MPHEQTLANHQTMWFVLWLCLYSAWLSGKQAESQSEIDALFFFPHFFLFYCPNHFNTGKTEGLCFIFIHAALLVSTLHIQQRFSASRRMQRIRQPSQNLPWMMCQCLQLVVLLDRPIGCLHLVGLLTCIVTVANVWAGQKLNFYLLPFAAIYASSKRFLLP